MSNWIPRSSGPHTDFQHLYSLPGSTVTDIKLTIKPGLAFPVLKTSGRAQGQIMQRGLPTGARGPLKPHRGQLLLKHRSAATLAATAVIPSLPSATR